MVLFSIQSASEIGRLSPMNIVFFTFTNAIVHWTSLINWFFIKFSCFFYLFYRTIWNEVDYKTIHRSICVWNEYLFSILITFVDLFLVPTQSTTQYHGSYIEFFLCITKWFTVINISYVWFQSYQIYGQNKNKMFKKKIESRK